MARFGDSVRRFQLKAENLRGDALEQCTLEVKHAIQFGSELVGAPGQPVDTGNLRNSWQHEINPERTQGIVSTPVEYAPYVEDGIGRGGTVQYGAKNGIGGSHSVKQVTANFDRIVEAVGKRLNGSAQGPDATPRDGGDDA
jgi:hypothetical protein